jgi:hypothetical protein
MKMTPRYRCVICGWKQIGFGSTAKPLKEGLCCDACFKYKVVPARIRDLRRVQLTEKEFNELMEKS